MSRIVPAVFDMAQEWRPGELHVLVKRIADHPTSDLHEHVFHEIVYVESGTVDHLTAQGVQKLHPGDVLVIKPRIWHQYRHPQSFTIINCLFDRGVLRQYGALLSLIEGAFELYRQPCRLPGKSVPTVLHARPAQRNHLLQALEAMMAEITEKRKDWRAAAIVRLLDLLVSIARLDHDRPATDTYQMANRAVEAIIEAADYIETHYAEPLYLNDLAKRLHLSPAYLSRSFAHRMGLGLIAYQHHVRIEEACRILRFTDEPITRVAGLVGYDEIAYFSRRFRREVGASPREYRLTYKGQ